MITYPTLLPFEALAAVRGRARRASPCAPTRRHPATARPSQSAIRHPPSTNEAPPTNAGGLKRSRYPLGLLLACFLAGAHTQAADWLEQLDQSLYLQSTNGWFRADLSGLLDLEGYYIDQRPPGLIFGGNEDFFNPRLSLFLDTRVGTHFYSLVQTRFDRGFDPRAELRAARVDEYLLRYTPFDDARLNLQVGKFATVFGNWVPRHDSWQNPFINAPLPYENVLIITDHAAPSTTRAFLGRRALPDNKPLWLPMIWGPSYASGASVFGSAAKWDYAVEVKNAGLASRPYGWDATMVGWENPTVTARVGRRPNAAWNIGTSFSLGAYLLPLAQGLPAGKQVGDFNQISVGQDLSFAWRHWQFWGEAIATRFEVPVVGNADTIAYFLEAKYKLTPRLSAALRWNQQLFDTVANGLGGRERWDDDIWRVETALSYRFTRHLQAKLQYSYSRQDGSLQQGEQLLAGQLTVKF